MIRRTSPDPSDGLPQKPGSRASVLGLPGSGRACIRQELLPNHLLAIRSLSEQDFNLLNRHIVREMAHIQK
jgi:hypothetical protein